MEKWQWTERLNPRKKKRGLKRRMKRKKKLIAFIEAEAKLNAEKYLYSDDFYDRFIEI